MSSKNGRDNVFSDGKPKSFPWFYIPVILGVLALVFVYNWFK